MNPDTYYLTCSGYDRHWNYDSTPTKQVSKGRTLTGKEIAKRKAKRAMANKSRKANRK